MYRTVVVVTINHGMFSLTNVCTVRGLMHLNSLNAAPGDYSHPAEEKILLLSYMLNQLFHITFVCLCLYCLQVNQEISYVFLKYCK